MENPMSLYQADLIELASEHLQYHIEGWILSGHELTKDVEEFYKWCLEQDKEALHCKRAKDRKSFYERREEVKRCTN